MITRITKTFTFEMAHALSNHDGPCKNIHGHSYRLEICLKGEPVEDDANPKNGMVMDFADLKKIVQRTVLDYFDHSLVLYEKAFPEISGPVSNGFGKLRRVNYQPTCENLLKDIWYRVLPELPRSVILSSIRLHETSTSFAELRADDNVH